MPLRCELVLPRRLAGVVVFDRLSSSSHFPGAHSLTFPLFGASIAGREYGCGSEHGQPDN
jgi:hypothetical protein